MMPCTVDHDDEARDRLHQRVGDVALTLKLHLALLSLRDVDAAGDDARDATGPIGHGRASPLDHAPLALRVRERVLVLRGCEVGCGVPEPLLHAAALVFVDEDLPEVTAPNLLLVLEATRRQRGLVLVHDPALEIDHDEQAGCRVRDGFEEAVLRAEVGLKPHVLEREACSGCDQVDELGLVGERWIVDECGDATAASLDRRDGPCRARCRLIDLVAEVVDPAAAAVEPVDDLERGVVQRLRQGVAQRDPVVQGDEHLGRG